MDDPVFKTKYIKYKTKVKLWEKSFKELNGRVPSKVSFQRLNNIQFTDMLYIKIGLSLYCPFSIFSNMIQYDIREAPSAIRDSYKMYYKLKSSFLEKTLSDALDEDSFDLSILESSSQTDSRLSGSFSEMPTPDVSALTSESSIIFQKSSIDKLHSSSMNIPKDQRESKEFEAEATNTVNETAWSSVSKSKSTNDNMDNVNDKLRKSMSDKLFRNSSFLKRNPRKSLSRNSLTGSQSSQSSFASGRKESLPDLETILSQKSKQQQENEQSEEHISMTPLDMKMATPNLAINLDEEWLNRCTKANSIGDDGMPINSSGFSENRTKSSDAPKTFGISNLNVVALATLEQNQKLADVTPKSMLSFDMGNLNLKSQNSFTANAPIITPPIDQDDEEIANSEDESDMNSSRLIRSARHSIKRKHKEIDREILTKTATITNDKQSIPITTNNNLKEAPKKSQTTTLRKTKSSNKIQSKARQPLPSKPKTISKSESQALQPIINNENQVKVAVVARKSSRNANKTKTYTELTLNDDIKSDQDEEDPFAGDDSDNDPNFSISQSPKSKRKSSNTKNSSSSDSSEDEQSKPNKESIPTTNTKKRISRVQGAKKSVRVKAEKRVAVPVKRKSSNKIAQVSDISENEMAQETPDDYLLEFGIENIKSVPRIPVNELEQNTKEFTKYVYNATSIENPNETTKMANKPKPLATKNAVAKDKLQNKVAAGTLNDNYVRLNLRKKVFVRGKKTMNFSRYKKKLWKSKKAAALSGPDMDMGGCDGGILTCFQCGLPGHFAQNCKAKSKYNLIDSR